MKKLLIALLALTTTAFASQGWLTDYEAAFAKAKESNKPVLAVFSGSDWCPPCKRLEKEVFESREFRDATKDGKFVPLFVDFPRQKSMGVRQKEKNAKLKSKFEVKSYPTILLLNAEGSILARKSGYGGQSPQDFLAWIEQKAK